MCEYIHVRVHVRLSCATAQWPFLPSCSFQTKLHGAAYGKGIYLSPISSISFGYSGRNGSFLATRPPPAPSSPHFPSFFFSPPCWLSALCVCNMAWLSSWNTSFSHVGAFHAILLSCSVLCVRFGCWALSPFSELVCHTVPYHTLCCGCVKWGCQWICVCDFVLCWLFILFGWFWAHTMVVFGAGYVDRRSAGCRAPPVSTINKPLSNGFPVLRMSKDCKTFISLWLTLSLINQNQ